MKSLIELAIEELNRHNEGSTQKGVSFTSDGSDVALEEARQYKGPGYSKRHYEEFASLLAKVPKNATHEEMVHHIAHHFAADNPRFQPERFKRAVEDRRVKE